MKKKIGLGLLGIILAGVGLAFAMTPNVEHGKALFEDPSLGGGTTGKTCATCHAGGTGLGEDFASKTQFSIMGQPMKDLAAVVNFCIEKPLGGTAIDPEGQDMLDLIAYMKVLKGQKIMDAPAKKVKKKKLEGC